MSLQTRLAVEPRGIIASASPKANAAVSTGGAEVLQLIAERSVNHCTASVPDGGKACCRYFVVELVYLVR
jgi:hypothetical protein